jgi:hypothetical protein
MNPEGNAFADPAAGQGAPPPQGGEEAGIGQALVEAADMAAQGQIPPQEFISMVRQIGEALMQMEGGGEVMPSQ